MTRHPSTPMLAIAVASLSACTCVSAQDEAPAVFANANAASRAELLHIVQQALHRQNVTLADDALTRDSELIIEPVQPRDTQGRYLNGRELRKPDHFRLLLVGSKCTIVHVETNERWSLREAKCVKASKEK